MAPAVSGVQAATMHELIDERSVGTCTRIRCADMSRQDTRRSSGVLSGNAHGPSATGGRDDEGRHHGDAPRSPAVSAGDGARACPLRRGAAGARTQRAGPARPLPCRRARGVGPRRGGGGGRDGRGDRAGPPWRRCRGGRHTRRGGPVGSTSPTADRGGRRAGRGAGHRARSRRRGSSRSVPGSVPGSVTGVRARVRTGVGRTGVRARVVPGSCRCRGWCWCRHRRCRCRSRRW